MEGKPRQTHVYGIDKILKILPHRFPFLLVDRVMELVTPDPKTRLGRRALAIKNVTMNEPFFTGHFPHLPIMPGVLLVETMAQVGALACFRETDPELDFFIANIRSAKFRQPVIPGDQLIVEAVVTRDRGSMLVISCSIKVHGTVVSEAEIMASVTPRVPH